MLKIIVIMKNKPQKAFWSTIITIQESNYLKWIQAWIK